ncbi:hypothetical protein [Bacillus toyonensis]|nr:hypothetical protein [Bacillus toyonensis]
MSSVIRNIQIDGEDVSFHNVNLTVVRMKREVIDESGWFNERS